MMKTILGMLLLGVALAACSKSEQSQSEQAQIKLATIQCNTCVANVEKALKEVEGVKATKIDLETKLAQVSFDPAKTDLAGMEKAITLAGYDANNIQRDSTGYAELATCCKLPEDRGGK